MISREEFGAKLMKNYKEKILERDEEFMFGRTLCQNFVHIFLPIIKTFLNILLVGLFLPIQTINLDDCLELSFPEDTIYLLLDFLTFCKWCSIAGLGCLGLVFLIGIFMAIGNWCGYKYTKDDCISKVNECLGGLCCCAQFISCIAFLALCGMIWLISNFGNLKNFFFFFLVIFGESLEIIYLLIPYFASGCISCLRTYSDIVDKQQQNSTNISSQAGIKKKKKKMKKFSSSHKKCRSDIESQIQNVKLKQLELDQQVQYLQRFQNLSQDFENMRKEYPNSLSYSHHLENNVSAIKNQPKCQLQSDASEIERTAQRVDYTNEEIGTMNHTRREIIPKLPLRKSNRLKPLKLGKNRILPDNNFHRYKK